MQTANLQKLLSIVASIFMGLSVAGCQPTANTDLGVFIPREKPVVVAFEPTPAIPGKEIVIEGRNFSADSSVVKVLFGSQEVSARLSSDSLIVVTVPLDAGDELVVDVAGKKSNALAFALRSVTPVMQILSAPPALTNSTDASFVFAMEVE